MKVKIKIVDPKAVVPYKKYDRDFCYDCVAVSEEEVAPNVWKYGLGFALQREKITRGNTIPWFLVSCPFFCMEDRYGSQ